MNTVCQCQICTRKVIKECRSKTDLLLNVEFNNFVPVNDSRVCFTNLVRGKSFLHAYLLNDFKTS